MNKLKFLFTSFIYILLMQNISLSQSFTELVIHGPNSSFGSFGNSIKSTEDINNDGYDDFIIGAPFENINTGKAYIYFGGAIIDTIPDLILSGESQYSNFGISVSGAGDVNGDGYNDVLVGASMYNNTYTGRAYVFYGGVNMDNIPDVILNGETANSDFGGTVASGDMNNDGYSDLVIAAYTYKNNSDIQTGRVYIFYGAENMDTIADVVITGESAYSNLGHGTPGTGDVNGDGYCDLVIGAYYYDNGRGRAYVHFGDQNMDNIPDLILSETGFSSGLGVSVAVVGDVNGDGFKDVVIGNGYTSAIGNALLYYGGAAMDNVKDKVFSSGIYNDFFAGSFNCISGTGDINNDGYDDLVIGAERNDSNKGKAYVFYGGADMDTTADKTFSGDAKEDYFGSSAAYAVNLKGDGRSSFFIGAPISNLGTGKVTLYQRAVSDFIYSVYPPLNAVNVNKDSEIDIVFNQNMNASTINESNIKVYGSSSGFMNFTVSYDPLIKKAQIDPDNYFLTGERIYVSLNSGILTSSGDSIDPFGYGFNIEVTQGDGNFSQTLSVEDTLQNLTKGDIDNDGDIDLVTLGIGDNILINGSRGYHYKVYKNNGQGDFTKTSEFNIGTGYAFDFPWNVKLADFNGDGYLDMLSQTGGISASLYITLNNGDGSFQNQPEYSKVIGSIAGVSIYDIDNDGDNDIVLNTEFSGLSILINNGSANFTLQVIVPGFEYYDYTPFVNDIDNNGYGDILVKNKILFNFNGVFKDTSALFTTNKYKNIYINDFDNDGDLDIAGSTSPTSIPFFTDILLNNGNGSFTLSQSFPNTTFVAGGNFDFYNGQSIDLILRFSGDKLYTNNGNGFFTESHPIGNSFGLTNANTADFNNDGSLDLIALGAFINTSGVYGFVNAYTYLNSSCNDPQYSISGNTTIQVGSENNLYVSTSDSGYWNISNFDNTQASLQTDPENDTVNVSAGNNLGHFVLYYTAHKNCGGDTLLSYHVYVDNPAPVELAQFNSNVNGRNVTLNWSTTTELNNSGFEIERAIDNGQLILEWTMAGFVEGNGTTDVPKDYTFIDRNINSGTYQYRLKQTDFNGNFEYFELKESVRIGIPGKYNLSQNYPNPFNPVTNIEYEISEQGNVTLKIFDVVGKELITLVNENKEPGYYSVQFNASDLSSGTYFYRLTAGNFAAVKKFIVLK